MLALVEDAGSPAIAALIEGGVTHILDGAINETRLKAGASFRRQAGRTADRQPRPPRATAMPCSAATRCSGAGTGPSAHCPFSPALVELLQIAAPGVDYSRWTVSDLVRSLDRSDRAGAVGAIRHAMDDLMPSAFAYSMPGHPERRLIQHLYPDPRGFSGEVEELDSNRRVNLRDRDPLTGLASRQGAIRWLEASQSDNRKAVVVLVGLGEFDRVNAAYGRLVGDAMLARVAVRLTRLVDAMGGRNTLVGRLTGTEFLVAMAGEPAADAPVERAGLLASELIAEIARPFNAGDFLIRLSARCGIATAGEEDGAERLIRRASTALAEARRGGAQGGIRIKVADDASGIIDDEQLLNDLRHALDNGQIQIVFQPQYAMADDSMIGVEALARWQHPQYGEIGAGVLFALAERAGFILPLSDHIHARALDEAAHWPAALSHLRVAINITAADIAEPDFVPGLLRMIDETGLLRQRITVELTESGLVEDLDAAATLLGQLREEGLAVAIDDFGTGYSSLAYLKSLPLDYLKIDSGIVRDITSSGRDRVIVRAIIDMARSLDLGVIAEGVETEIQLAALARAGATCYQGFLRSPPVTSELLVGLVTA